MEGWNRKTHPQVTGVQLGDVMEGAPLRVAVAEDDEGVKLDLVLAVGVDLGVTSARLPIHGQFMKVKLTMANNTTLVVNGRVSAVMQVWGLQPIGEAHIRIEGKKVEVMPAIVLASASTPLPPPPEAVQ